MPDASPPNTKCLFTGEDTSSREHVIPMWLQRRFKLQEQYLVIPNGTRLKYKNLTIPAEGKANNAFGRIESRISQGIFDPAEIYLWALKIHVGCIFRDSSLRFDIKNPESPFVLDVDDFDSEIAMFRLLYENWAANGTTTPSPFGSVHIIDSLLPVGDFDFFHCLVTGTVGIHLGGKFIVVFLWDQGASQQSNMKQIWQTYHLPTTRSKANDAEYHSHCYMAHHVWACEGAYGLYRRRCPFSFIRTSKEIVQVPSLVSPASRPMDESEYRYICGAFGLDLIKFNGETHNVYAPRPRLQR